MHETVYQNLSPFAKAVAEYRIGIGDLIIIKGEN